MLGVSVQIGSVLRGYIKFLTFITNTSHKKKSATDDTQKAFTVYAFLIYNIIQKLNHNVPQHVIAKMTFFCLVECLSHFIFFNNLIDLCLLALSASGVSKIHEIFNFWNRLL